MISLLSASWAALIGLDLWFGANSPSDQDRDALGRSASNRKEAEAEPDRMAADDI